MPTSRRLFEAQYKKELIVDTPERQCFRYETSNLVYLDKYDMIRVYVLEFHASTQTNTFSHVAERSVSLGTRVEFKEADFE